MTCAARKEFQVQRATAALAFLAFAALSARAEDYPTRPIRLLVPYAPGGIADIAARLLGAKLTDAWGQQVIVENRPGGNGFIAVGDAAKSTPDGYTLVVATAGDITVNPILFKNVPYDVDKDFAPVSAVSDAPMVFATGGGSPYKTLADAIAAAKAQPNTLGVGTPGYGSMNHLVLESIQLADAVKFVHVPYKGGAPAAQALVAGDIPFGIVASSSAAPHLASGHIRVLAVTTGKRSPLNPDWPTLREAGAGDIAASNWTALLAPKGTPQPIIDKLSAEVGEILNTPDIKDRFAAGGVFTIPSTPGDLAERIRRETAIYRVIIEKANVHVD